MGDDQFVGHMPHGLINNENSVSTRNYQRRYFIKMPLHRRGIAAGQNKGGADTALGACSAENPRRLCALIFGSSEPRSSCRPSPCEFCFLSNPRFVLPPNLYWCANRELAADLFQRAGKAFLKSSMSNSFCPLFCGRAEILLNCSLFNPRPTVGTSRETLNSSHIHDAKSIRRRRTTPWISGIGPSSTI